MSFPNIDALADTLDSLTLSEMLESKGMVRWSARDVLDKYEAFLKDDSLTVDDKDVVKEDLIVYLDSWKFGREVFKR